MQTFSKSEKREGLVVVKGIFSTSFSLFLSSLTSDKERSPALSLSAPTAATAAIATFTGKLLKIRFADFTHREMKGFS
jgi:hypothetical protein